MNLSQERQHFTLEIPATRKAFWDWYHNDQNKNLIYYIVLVIWTGWTLDMIVILALTATSVYRSAFYVPFFFFGMGWGPLTHLFIQCAFNRHDVQHRERYHTISLDEKESSIHVELNDNSYPDLQ